MKDATIFACCLSGLAIVVLFLILGLDGILARVNADLVMPAGGLSTRGVMVITFLMMAVIMGLLAAVANFTKWLRTIRKH